MTPLHLLSGMIWAGIVMWWFSSIKHFIKDWDNLHKILRLVLILFFLFEGFLLFCGLILVTHLKR